MDCVKFRNILGNILLACLLGVILYFCVTGIWFPRSGDSTTRVLSGNKAADDSNVTDAIGHVSNALPSKEHEENDLNETNTDTPMMREKESNYRILLNNRNNSSSGKVYIQTDGELKFLCNDNFTDADASVVCRELGFKHAIIYNSMSLYPYTRYTTYHPVLKQLNCTGSESSIHQCPGFRLRIITNCTWFATVVCYDDKPYRLRLVNGHALGSGLVEMEVGGEWGTFCAIRNFNDDLADILCRNMDYIGGVTLPRGELGEVNISKVWVPYISCSEGKRIKASIFDCSLTLHTENILHDFEEFRNNRYKNEYMACFQKPSHAAAVQCFKHEFQG